MAEKGKIISIYNMKGGVGKTTVAVNLAYTASVNKNKTLLIDLDAQGAASYYFRIKPLKKLKAKALLKPKSNIDKEIKGSDFEFLDILPSHLSYRGLDIILNQKTKSDDVISRIFKPLQKQYAYIFIDSPPNLTLLTQNIFQASDIVLVPIIPSTLSVRAYHQIFDFFHKKNADLSKFLAFFSMVEKRKTMHNNIMNELFKNDAYFLKTFIPYLSEIEKMGINREPIIYSNPKSPASMSFIDLWNELQKYIT